MKMGESPPLGAEAPPYNRSGRFVFNHVDRS
jgi:hypothetical protein